jgi:cysteine desulfurase
MPDVERHVAAEVAAPHILSVGFPGTQAEPLLHALEARGVFASAGSACHAKTKRPSPALSAIGVRDDVATLRFSLSRDTTEMDIDHAIAVAAPARAELVGQR